MTYPPAAINQLVASILSWSFIAGLLCFFLGNYVFTALNFQKGLQLVQLMKDNQLATIGILFACQMLANQLLSTGAFEVTFNDELVFSRLQTGQVPSIPRLVQTMRERIRDMATLSSGGTTASINSV
jgi:selT/selW/selH-like putative selenoprotein